MFTFTLNIFYTYFITVAAINFLPKKLGISCMHKILKDINFTKNAWNNDKLTIKIKYFLKTGINHLLHCAKKKHKVGE